MSLIVRVLVGLIVAIVIYVVLTAFIGFTHSNLIFGLLALLAFVLIVFGPAPAGRWRL